MARRARITRLKGDLTTEILNVDLDKALMEIQKQIWF